MNVYRRRRLAALLALTAVLVAGWVVLSQAFGTRKHGAAAQTFRLTSRALRRKVAVSVIVPAGANGAHRPLLVFLHGRSGTNASELGNDTLYAALAKAGDRAPVIAFPDGGRDKYWHDRRSGAWGRWVTGEVIPAVTKRFGTDPRRIAIGGISMGGFGALDIARLHPGRFCAAGAHSPAIWQTGGETAPGAFDDAADFGRHDLVGTARRNPKAFSRQPIWVDAGRSDPFQPGDRTFVAALQRGGVRVHDHLTSAGGHEHSYWVRHWPEYVAFYARELARCK